MGTVPFLVACDGSPTEPEVGVAFLVIEPSDVTIAVEQTVHLTALPLGEDGVTLPDIDVTWLTSDTAVATVDSDGTVAGTGVGLAVITATVGNQSGHALVTVGVRDPFERVSAGDFHSCGITTEGEAFCWGHPTNGELGIGPSLPEGDQTRPRPVQTDVRFQSVSAGVSHTCAIAVDQFAHCWGFNHFGELGDGDVTGASKYTPVRVQLGAELTGLSASWGTCGITVAESRGYCWGPDFYGGAGNGRNTYFGHGAIAVEGDLEFRSITTGASEFACGVTTAGDAYCWGRGDRAQLGNGSTQSTNPSPVPVSGGHSFASVEAGSTFACAIADTGDMYCWGDNQRGQLGNGTTDLAVEPLLVAGGLEFASVSAGALHVCAQTVDGSAYCWGDNQYGQFGDGSTESSATPREVLTCYSFTSLSAGLGHTCGVTADGTGYCWGRNDHAQLGNGSYSDSSTPVEVR